MLLRRSIVIVTASCALGCGSDDVGPSCTLPNETMYSCQPVPNGSHGCVGGPVWSAVQRPIDGSLHRDDDDKTFPVGCTADIPDCSTFLIGAPRRFECDNGEPPQWGELR